MVGNDWKLSGCGTVRLCMAESLSFSHLPGQYGLVCLDVISAGPLPASSLCLRVYYKFPAIIMSLLSVIYLQRMVDAHAVGSGCLETKFDLLRSGAAASELMMPSDLI